MTNENKLAEFGRRMMIQRLHAKKRRKHEREILNWFFSSGMEKDKPSYHADPIDDNEVDVFIESELKDR